MDYDSERSMNVASNPPRRTAAAATAAAATPRISQHLDASRGGPPRDPAGVAPDRPNGERTRKT